MHTFMSCKDSLYKVEETKKHGKRVLEKGRVTRSKAEDPEEFTLSAVRRGEK